MSPEQRAQYIAEATIRQLNTDFMASAFGLTTSAATFAESRPLTLADVEAAIEMMEAMPRPKDLTTAEVFSLLRLVLIECLRLKEENKQLRAPGA